MSSSGKILTGIPEEFRVLKNHIISHHDRPLKAVMVTSAAPGEGTSTVVARLAKAFAEEGIRVIIIDTNYRRHTPLSIYHNPSDLVRDKLNINDTVLNVLHPSGMDNYFIVSDDCLDVPTETDWLAKTKKLLSMLDHIKKSFDMVFIDTAPVLTHSESLMVASQTDGVIITVRADKTKRQLVIKARDELLKVNANIIGVVLNKKRHVIPPFFYNR